MSYHPIPIWCYSKMLFVSIILMYPAWLILLIGVVIFHIITDGITNIDKSDWMDLWYSITLRITPTSYSENAYRKNGNTWKGMTGRDIRNAHTKDWPKWSREEEK